MKTRILFFSVKKVALALYFCNGGGGLQISPYTVKVGALDEKSAQPFKARTLENE